MNAPQPYAAAAAAQQNNQEDTSEEEYYTYDERVCDALELLNAVYDHPNSPHFPTPLKPMRRDRVSTVSADTYGRMPLVSWRISLSPTTTWLRKMWGVPICVVNWWKH